jgi:putative NIF3 family GTP cyclohydrolase 1 type 2
LRVLLDENLPQKLREYLAGHEVETAVYAGFGGYKNGVLLRSAIKAGFDVLVTGDLSITYQQNLGEHPIALVSLTATAGKF